MEKAGMLKRDPARGIYHKEKLTGLPFQIVITGELEGDEYAAYRALTDRAKEEDVLCVLKIDGRETDVAMHFNVTIDLIAKKNPGLMGTYGRKMPCQAAYCMSS